MHWSHHSVGKISEFPSSWEGFHVCTISKILKSLKEVWIVEDLSGGFLSKLVGMFTQKHPNTRSLTCFIHLIQYRYPFEFHFPLWKKIQIWSLSKEKETKELEQAWKWTTWIWSVIWKYMEIPSNGFKNPNYGRWKSSQLPPPFRTPSFRTITWRTGSATYWSFKRWNIPPQKKHLKGDGRDTPFRGSGP